MKAQFAFCSGGEIGFSPAKKIVPYLPESKERPQKMRRQSVVDGYQKEDEEEERDVPNTSHLVDRMFMIFQTNLMMCLFSLSSPSSM